MELFDDFVEVLKRPDVTILTEIFAAREDNETGISSADLAAKIPGSIYCPTLEDVTEKLRELARPGDLLLTVGAGDIYLAGEALIKKEGRPELPPPCINIVFLTSFFRNALEISCGIGYNKTGSMNLRQVTAGVQPRYDLMMSERATQHHSLSTIPYLPLYYLAPHFSRGES